MNLTPMPAVWRGGSVTGLEHVRLGRNNQDALAACELGGLLSVVVTDGCGSGAFSEVGARLGASYFARELCAQVAVYGFTDEAVHAAGEALLAWLEPVARGLGDVVAGVAEHLLFSVLAAVTDGDQVLVCGAGDGLFTIDGRLTVVEPGKGNAPAYLTYRLVPKERLTAPADPRLVTHFNGHAREVVIATDGALALVKEGSTALSELALSAFVGTSPYLLRRRLTVLAERERRLLDDTTVAVVRLPGAMP